MSERPPEPGTRWGPEDRARARDQAARRRPARSARLADGAGVLGASFAALCCAGTPLVVSALAGVGLGFLRTDAILWPLMFVSLAVAFWGFWQGRRAHGSAGPLALAAAGAGALVAGVVFIHGYPARQVIWAGAVALVVATLWNATLRRRCAARSWRTAPHA